MEHPLRDRAQARPFLRKIKTYDEYPCGIGFDTTWNRAMSVLMATRFNGSRFCCRVDFYGLGPVLGPVLGSVLDSGLDPVLGLVLGSRPTQLGPGSVLMRPRFGAGFG